MGGDGYLGEFEQMLLLAALHLGEEAYGAALGQELEARVGRRVSRGAIYVTLDRLEAKGLIRSAMSAPRAERGGRPRRIVSVTPEGVAQLQASREALVTLWDGLEVLEG
ncbi:MAG: PadR family transcriptional regulator [Gemmatimonadales bacterium]|jgi:DNA-binding PadR family transcriptional regulator|nr:MAG: PadR family transcriptional regulator [Gemmatimonadales bacterium]